MRTGPFQCKVEEVRGESPEEATVVLRLSLDDAKVVAGRFLTDTCRVAFAPVVEDCAGEGRCHGPVSWCPNCGDVTQVCDDPSWCDIHPRSEENDVE